MKQDLPVSTFRSFSVHVASSSRGPTGVWDWVRVSHTCEMSWMGVEQKEGCCPRVKRQLVLLSPRLHLSTKQQGDGLHQTFTDSPGGQTRAHLLLHKHLHLSSPVMVAAVMMEH